MKLATLYPSGTWTVFTDGLSISRGSRYNLTLESKVGLTVKVSLCFEFNITSSEEEYEALIIGLTLEYETGEEEVKL